MMKKKGRFKAPSYLMDGPAHGDARAGNEEHGVASLVAEEGDRIWNAVVLRSNAMTTTAVVENSFILEYLGNTENKQCQMPSP